MAFDQSKYQVIQEVSLGQVNGWRGEVVMVHYRYDKNTPSVKVILKGDGARGSYENVLVKGMSIQSLRDVIIPALTEFVGVTVEPMLSTVTKRFISKKIQELGSIDKVEAFYNKDDTASRFAKQEAERLLT